MSFISPVFSTVWYSPRCEIECSSNLFLKELLLSPMYKIEAINDGIEKWLELKKIFETLKKQLSKKYFYVKWEELAMKNYNTLFIKEQWMH